MPRRRRYTNPKDVFAPTLTPEEVRRINADLKADLIRLGAVPGYAPGQVLPASLESQTPVAPPLPGCIDAVAQQELSFVRNALKTKGYSFRGMTFAVQDMDLFMGAFFSSPKPFCGAYADLAIRIAPPSWYQIAAPQGCSQGVQEVLHEANAYWEQCNFRIEASRGLMGYSTKFPDYLAFESRLDECISIVKDSGFRIVGVDARVVSPSRVLRFEMTRDRVVVSSDAGKPVGLEWPAQDSRQSVMEFLVQCPYVKLVK